MLKQHNTARCIFGRCGELWSSIGALVRFGPEADMKAKTTKKERHKRPQGGGSDAVAARMPRRYPLSRYRSGSPRAFKGIAAAAASSAQTGRGRHRSNSFL